MRRRPHPEPAYPVVGTRPVLRIVEDPDDGELTVWVGERARLAWRGLRSSRDGWLACWHPTIADPSDWIAGGWFLVRDGAVTDRGPVGLIDEVTILESGLLAFIESDADGEDDRCTVCVHRDGATLLDHRLAGHAWSLAVAPDERSLAVVTARERGNVIVLLDLLTGGVRWEREGVGTGVHAVAFEDGFLMALDQDPRYPSHRPVGRYRHAIEDGATDARAVRRESIRVGHARWSFPAIRDELREEPPDGARAAELIACIERELAALTGVVQPGPWVRQQRAQAERLAGEVLAVAGDERGALERWDRALSLDPGVGIAKRAATLRDRLG